MILTVLTSSLPQRGALLARAMRSVKAQTFPPEAHVVHVDLARGTCAQAYNRLARSVDTEWLTFLDDDDTFEPEHLETITKSYEAEPDVDVVYTRPNCVGHHCAWYYEPFSIEVLERRSIVPITAVVRTEVFRQAGGFQEEWGADWRLWQRIASQGGRFRALEQTTWTYHRHGLGQRSYGEL